MAWNFNNSEYQDENSGRLYDVCPLHEYKVYKVEKMRKPTRFYPETCGMFAESIHSNTVLM
jgi:hypothetical protein